MLKIYGSMLCKDCVACRQAYDQAGVAYEFLDFAVELTNLKEFLQLRDGCDVFAEAKDSGQIGIPCVVAENGDVILAWEALLPSKDQS